jgi:hypothetical protein
MRAEPLDFFLFSALKNIVIENSEAEPPRKKREGMGQKKLRNWKGDTHF